MAVFLQLKWIFAMSLCIRLTCIDELDCSFNEIEALPATIGQCVNMRTFAADHNFLAQLPPEVSVRIGLEILIRVFTVCSESHWCARFTDGQLEEGNCAVSTFQQAGVFARGDGRHAKAQSRQPQQQQVSLLCLLYFYFFCIF